MPMRSSEEKWYEIKLDAQEAQKILDDYFRIAAVLTSKIWSNHPRSPQPPPQIEIAQYASWKDVGNALRARYLEQANQGCDCYSCQSQRTKRGQRENYWVRLVTFAEMGDPSELVKRLKSRRVLTRFDRM